MKKYIKVTLCFFITLTCSSCASVSDHLSDAEKNEIHTVSVNTTVPVPSTIEYSGSHMIGAGVLGGLIGQGIAYASESSTREAIIQTMDRNNIKLNQMMYRSFINELRDQTNFTVTQDASYDAQFKITILSYGFSEGNRENLTVPFVSIEVQLLNPQGKVIWQTYKEAYLNSRKFYGYNMQNYITNPVLLKKAYQSLAVQASDDAISSLMY